MTKPANAYGVQLPRGPRLVLVLLTVSQVLDAMRAAGAGAADSAIKRECFRRSLRKIGERDVTYTDLVGEQLQEALPRTRHQTQGMFYWTKLHEPSPEEVRALIDAAAISDDGGAETWTVRLPDGRAVAIQEQPGATVDQALARARRAGGSEAAQSLTAAVEGLRGAVLSIDGRKPDLAGKAFDAAFSVKDVLLLSQVYSEIQAGAVEDFEEGVEGVVPMGEGSGGSGG
jgi:hypothetical protein